VDSLGQLPRNPYIIALTKGNKQLTVIGVMHSRDTTSPVFAQIEREFNKRTPDVIINEGGVLTKTYHNRNQAIAENGEIGLEKYLADVAAIPAINGDAPFKEEFEALSSAFNEDEAILQYASERFLLPCKYAAPPADLRRVYEKDFVVDYAIKQGVKLTGRCRSFEYYKDVYKRVFGREFSLSSMDPSVFVALSDAHHMCAVTRKSKEIRDQYLLQEIERQLKEYNKVMVVYGGWHVLAIEPALKELIAECAGNLN
jgi:hypothetical protein